MLNLKKIAATVCTGAMLLTTPTFTRVASAGVITGKATPIAEKMPEYLKRIVIIQKGITTQRVRRDLLKTFCGDRVAVTRYRYILQVMDQITYNLNIINRFEEDPNYYRYALSDDLIRLTDLIDAVNDTMLDMMEDQDES